MSPMSKEEEPWF